MTSDFVLPDVEHPVSGPFWAACRQDELRIQACAGCGRRRMPPRLMCPWCRSLDVRWDPVAPTGTVWSFAIPHPPLLPAYEARLPYAVLVVTLDDDPAIRLVGDTAAGVDQRSIEIGQAVEARFERVADDVVLPRWSPLPRQ
ncbi:MAG: Zn-ribbon domain-containing OB-fold protein [Acidimicrobiales bacterium]